MLGGCNAGAVPLARLVVIEPVAFGLLEQAGEVKPHQQFMTTREGYFQAFRDAATTHGVGQFAVILSVAPSVGVDLTPIDSRDAAEIERSITAFGQTRWRPDSGSRFGLAHSS